MLATQIEVSDGTLSIISVGIQFFKQTDVSVSLDQSDLPLTLGVDYVWSAATTITFLASALVPGGLVPNGVEVFLRRDTKNDSMYNILDGGAPFSRLTLDENYKQLLYLTQEFSEGLGLDGLRNSLDMHGYKVVNVGPPTSAGDATNKAYVDTGVAGTVSLVDNLNKRTLRVSPSEDPLVFLPPVGTRANKVLGFDSAGQPVGTLPGSGSAMELALDLLHTTDTNKMAALVRFLQAGLGAVSRTLLDKARDVKTLQDFGAVADGVTDNWVAIQDALNSGKNIYVLPGIYGIGKTLTVTQPDTQIYGGREGYIGTQIKTLPGFVGTYIYQVNNYGFVHNALMAIGNGTARGVGATIKAFNFNRADNSADIDSYVTNSGISYCDTAITAVGKNLQIRDNLIGQCKRGITYDARVGTACYGYRIIGNRFHGVGGADYAGSADNDPAVTGPNVGYCIDTRGAGDVTFTEISNNYSDTSGTFFIGRLPYGTLAANIVKDAWSTGIQVESSTHVSIFGNQVRSGFSSKFTGNGIHLTATVSMSLVANNIVNAFGGHGIFHETGNQCTFNGNVTTDNNFGSTGNFDGMHFAVGTNSNIVTGNTSRTTTGGATRQRYGIYTAGASNYFNANMCQANVTADFFDDSTTTCGFTQSTVAMRRTLWLSAIPVSGKFQRGDTIINVSPTAGGPSGWTCITSGSPGIWKVTSVLEA